jgi:hypothetical protein
MRTRLRQGRTPGLRSIIDFGSLSTLALSSQFQPTAFVDGVVEAVIWGAKIADLGAVGLSPTYAAAIGTGALVRVASLPLSLYSDRAVARHAAAMPALQQCYQQYAEVATHPRALREELELAHEKLLKRRRQVLLRYDTFEGSPQILAAISFAAAAFGVASAAWSVTKHSPGAAWGVAIFGVDPTLPLTAFITLRNVDYVTSIRTGFGERTDEHQAKLRKAARDLVLVTSVSASVLMVAAFGVTTSLPTVVMSAAFWAQAMAPVALGASLAGMLRRLIGSSAMLKKWARWPSAYPSQHGQYGATYSPKAHAELIRKVLDEVEGTTHRQNYYNAKHTLESECDLRIQRMPIAKKFFRDTRFDKAPEEAPNPLAGKNAFDMRV